MSTILKRCTKCGKEKPATTEYFCRDKQKKDGLHSQCKECNKPGSAAREKKSKYMQEYTAKNKEKLDEYHKAYRATNKGKIARANKEWRRENKDRMNEYNRAHYAKNRDRARIVVRASKQRRRARQAGLPDSFTPQDWQRALDYFDSCCAVCSRPLNGLFHTAAADHWISLADPSCPGTIPTNIVPLCHKQDGCNNSKGDKPAAEWLESKFGKRKAAAIRKRINEYFDHVRSNPL